MYYCPKKSDGLGFDPISMATVALVPLSIAAQIYGQKKDADAAKKAAKAEAKQTAAEERMQAAALQAQQAQQAEARAFLMKMGIGGAIAVAGIVALVIIARKR
jgi:hypothetical protein